MEKFDHQQYRDNLADDLKGVRSEGVKGKEEAIKIQKEESSSIRYKKAKELHQQEITNFSEGISSLRKALKKLKKDKTIIDIPIDGEEAIKLPIGDLFANAHLNEGRRINAAFPNESRDYKGIELLLDENDFNDERSLIRARKEFFDKNHTYGADDHDIKYFKMDNVVRVLREHKELFPPEFFSFLSSIEVDTFELGDEKIIFSKKP